MTNQPKPASGEWTVGYVMMKLGVNSQMEANRIADAHNATLAAEREKYLSLHADYRYAKEQLAVEREKYEREITKLAWQCEDTKQLREQLAAEREKVQTLTDALTGIRDAEKETDPVAFKGTIDLIDAALDAERAKVQTLTSTLRLIAMTNSIDFHVMARDALEKVK